MKTKITNILKDKIEDIQIWYNHLFVFDVLYYIKNIM
jgi:hypothetical protein